MKDLGEARFLLGIEIRRQENGDVFLVQEKYARDVLSRFNMGGCKSVSTPLELGNHLDSTRQPTSEFEVEQMANIPYRSAIGSLMYLSTCTRPDISAAVSELSKFSQNPEATHWEGVMSAGQLVECCCIREVPRLECGGTLILAMRGIGRHPGGVRATFSSVLMQQSHGDLHDEGGHSFKL